MANLSSYTQYKENPFVNEVTTALMPLKRQNIIMGTPDHVIVNKDSGEMSGEIAIKTFKIVDEASFVKIYINQLKDIFSLKPNAMKVLAYIMTVTPINKDKILFSIDDCKIHTGYNSATTITQGLAILIEKEIIARSDKPYFYFINPTVYFNGNRIYLVNEYRKANKTKEIPTQPRLFPDKNEQQPSKENTNS